MHELRWGRRGVSSMIGGIIILSLLLTALGTMVFVSKQYDSYQSVVSGMSQYDIQRFSENLVANYPGLALLTSTVACTGSSSGQCNVYNMTLSNVGGITNAGSSNGGISGGSGGGVGISIVRIYVNGTVSGQGCSTPNLCILNPASSPTAYAFSSSNEYVNPGEINHAVLLWLPSTVTLDSPTPPSPANTVSIITSRGRVFSFQWPFPPTGEALQAVNANVATGTMKVAYTGADNSHNEPTWGGPRIGQYCHSESSVPSDAINAGTYGTLYFVNPWVIDTILGDAALGSPPPTTLFIYAQFVNTQATSVTITTGSLLIQVTSAAANQKVFFIGGQYIGGVAGSGSFVAAPNPLTVSTNQEATLIFQMVQFNVGTKQNPTQAVTLSFSGMAAVSNAATDSSYFGASLLLEGFYDRTSCSTP